MSPVLPSPPERSTRGSAHSQDDRSPSEDSPGVGVVSDNNAASSSGIARDRLLVVREVCKATFRTSSPSAVSSSGPAFGVEPSRTPRFGNKLEGAGGSVSNAPLARQLFCRGAVSNNPQRASTSLCRPSQSSVREQLPGPWGQSLSHEVSSFRRSRSYGASPQKRERCDLSDEVEALPGPDQIVSIHSRKWKVVVHTFGCHHLGKFARDMRNPRGKSKTERATV
jgi:hypothetical protein